MIQFPVCSTARIPAPDAPVVVPPATTSLVGPVSGLPDLPPELWLLSARYLPAADQAAFFYAHPQAALADEARAAAATAAIRAAHDVAAVSALMLQTQDLPARQRARVVTEAVRWGCASLARCSIGEGEQVFHDLLVSCMDLADTLPASLKNHVLAVLLLRLPRPYCNQSDFDPLKQGRFATRLMTGLLAAASDGDSHVCRAIARSGRGLVRLIDLEYGVVPGPEHAAARAARAVEFMRVLARPEILESGESGEAVSTASSLLSYFLADQMQAHLPMLRALVRTTGNGGNHPGLRYLAEIVYLVPDSDARAELMCDMVASAKAGAAPRGPTAVSDAVNDLARQLRRSAEALNPQQRASVNSALASAGFRGAPL